MRNAKISTLLLTRGRFGGDLDCGSGPAMTNGGMTGRVERDGCEIAGL